MIPAKAAQNFVPTAINTLGQAFSRSNLNQQYTAQLSNNGMVGNTLGVGIQLNYMAMLERSFRERHKTDVRCQMHLSGRRLAHGDTSGVHTGGVQPYVQAFLTNTVMVQN